jgi:hypothetical protein
LEQYDSRTKGTLTTDFIQKVFKKKNYTFTQFLTVLFYDWIPTWLQEQKEHWEAITALKRDLRLYI